MRFCRIERQLAAVVLFRRRRKHRPPIGWESRRLELDWPSGARNRTQTSAAERLHLNGLARNREGPLETIPLNEYCAIKLSSHLIKSGPREGAFRWSCGSEWPRDEFVPADVDGFRLAGKVFNLPKRPQEWRRRRRRPQELMNLRSARNDAQQVTTIRPRPRLATARRRATNHSARTLGHWETARKAPLGGVFVTNTRTA